MVQKTVSVEKPYSKEEIETLRKEFEFLEKAGHSKSVQEYAKKVLARIKP